MDRLDPIEALRRIESAIAGLTLEKIESERLAKDLERVRKRLEKREYTKADLARNDFDVRDRVKEFFGYMSFYAEVGKTWARLLTEIRAADASRVIDVCPGWSPKIELGLYHMDYAGEVVAIDSSAEALGELSRFMGLLRNRFGLRIMERNIFEDVGIAAPLVLANHVMDDLALGYASSLLGGESRSLYTDESTVRDLWHRIVNDEDRFVSELAPLIAESLSRLVEPRGHLVISQYASYTERLLELGDAVAFCERLLRETCVALYRRGFEPRQEIAERALEGYAGQFGASDCAVIWRPG